MKVHHLSCGSMCPLGGHAMDGVTPGIGPANMACHCLLIESSAGLVLVDTGFGFGEIAHLRQRIPAFFRALCRPHIKPEETALRQVERLGFRGSDVRHIVLTHLDFDHAGGICDFPHAQVHVFRREYENANRPHGFVNQRRFRRVQWPKPEQWQKYEAGGEKWYGFECVRNLSGLPPEILMVPLIGHTWGHCGVAVDCGNGWLLHAGDAYFFHGEKDPAHPNCPVGARLYQTMMEVDRRARLLNQDRIRNLVRERGREITVFCSHDRTEFDRLSGVVHSSASGPSTGAARDRSA